MKRISILVLATVLIMIQTGCQAGPFAALSRSFAGGMPKRNLSDQELAAYGQPVQPSTNHVNNLSQVQYNQPLGYRRGSQPCLT